MKTLLLSLLTIVLVTANANGQSKKLIHDYKIKPITDTVYLYIEKKFTDSDGNVVVIQQDLQTGGRWETRCKCNYDSIPKAGTITRIRRSKIEDITPLTRKQAKDSIEKTEKALINQKIN